MSKRRKGHGPKTKGTAGKASLFEEVKKAFKQNPQRSMNQKQVGKIAGVEGAAQKEEIIAILETLEKQEFIKSTSYEKFQLNYIEEYAEGVVESITSGSAFVIVEGRDQDVFIHWRKLNQALNGDKVQIKLHPGKKKPEGEVLSIIERKRTHYIGTVEVNPKFAFFIPDDQKINVDFYIPLVKLNGAKEGQKVIATISDWPKESKNPFGKIVEVLGDASDNDVIMNSILFEYDLPSKFPPHVEREADKISMEVDKKEIAKRRDMRSAPTFTIDPHDAKDFDDALSVQKLENGNYEIGVHIADVSHYITPGSIMDEEAYNRATSIYLVDRVVPMLPEKLSNGVCSLRPNEEKLCFSAVFEMDEHSQVIKQWFGRTVIYSDHRFAYEDAQEIIEGKSEGPFKEEVLLLDGLAKKLRVNRLKKGGITFDRVEVIFNLDPEGKPTGVYFKKSKDANKLIEEFMLLANRRVAHFIGDKSKKERTFVYRIHDKPTPEKFEQFATFVNQFGYNVRVKDTKDISKSISNLLTEVEGKKESNMIETLAIRTMAKAEYSTNNIGHYGLSFEYYSHFTSPIRRYPDVMVHRLLQHYLDAGKTADKDEYEEMCIHCSKQEKTASEAERDSIKYKQVEFMSDHIGEEFEAVVSGVTDWGIYAEIIENMCEGMISIKTIEDDDYQFDQENYCIVGRLTGNKIQLGDKILIKIKTANLVKKQLDFSLVRSLEE